MKLLKLPTIRSGNLLDLYIAADLRKLALATTTKNGFHFALTPLLEASKEEVPTPKVRYDAKVRLPAKILIEYLSSAIEIRDNVRLEVDSGDFAMTTVGESSSLSSRITTSEGVQISGNASAVYNLNHLLEMVKGAKAASDQLVLEFGTNCPARVNCVIPNAHLSYYLAPRIEDDEKPKGLSALQSDWWDYVAEKKKQDSSVVEGA